MHRFEPLSAAHFKPLPSFLESKRAIINIQNNDQRCFAYALLSALKPHVKRPNRANSYIEFLQSYGLNGISYPIQPSELPALEEKLRLRINLFSFYDDKGQARYPLYISKQSEEYTEIDLLYWEGHYAWIKNFPRFICDVRHKHDKRFLCKRCFGVLISESFQSLPKTMFPG